MPMRTRRNSLLRYSAAAVLALALLLVPTLVLTHEGQWFPAEPLHYAPNGNFGADGRYIPVKAGFNLADVGSASQLETLPAEVKGLVWIGQCNGDDEAFRKAVQPFVGNPKVFGFYLMDDPDPRGMLSGKLSAPCTPEKLRAESDWIHQQVPGTKTFITLMNLSTSQKPSYKDSYNLANSHVDLFGIDPYPCRSELHGCDYDMIDRYVAAAKSWGIPASHIVPVYQAFGGGNWEDGDGGRYLLPTAEQERAILDRWRAYVGAPEFDTAYSWGSQHDDTALETASELRDVFSAHNQAHGPLNWLAANVPSLR